MSSCLQINSQTWNLWRSEGLKLLLPRIEPQNSIYFQTDWSFVPAEVDPATVPVETPKLRVRLIGNIPELKDWRDLENLRLGFFEDLDEDEEEDQPDPLRGPDIWIFQPGSNADPEFSKWRTKLKFGERRGYEFDFSLEGLKLSERAANYQVDNAVKAFFQQPLPPEWEQPEWINEGDRLTFEGRILFREILCSVPLNCPEPVGYARRQAKNELVYQHLGQHKLSKIDQVQSPHKYEEGICATGCLVVLNVPSE